MTQVSVGPHRDGWLIGGVSCGGTIELAAGNAEDDVAIGHDGTRSSLVFAGDDDRVDTVRSEDAGDRAQACVRTAGDHPCMHRIRDRPSLVWRGDHRTILTVDAQSSGAPFSGPRRGRTIGVAMEQYVIAARLKPGKAAEAERQLAGGPPFDPGEIGLSGHAAYLTDENVYLVFEGDAARSTALQLAREHLVEVSRWQGIVSGLPASVAAVPAEARCLYHWKRESPEEKS
jgi:hypothetical protein